MDNHEEQKNKKIDHSKMDHSKMNDDKEDHSKMDHSKMEDPKSDDHSKMDHSKMDHGSGDHSGHNPGHGQMGHDHHKMMIADFRKRFWVTLVLTIPILFFSPMIQEFFGYEFLLPGNPYILFALSTIVYFFGGWPFLKGFWSEVKKGAPGMMTLISMAISVAYFYSTATVFFLGTFNTDRNYAFRPLDRNEKCIRCIKSLTAFSKYDASRSPQGKG